MNASPTTGPAGTDASAVPIRWRPYRRPRSVHEVAARQLCTGCGVCAYLAPHEVRMVDVLDHGRRPLPIIPVGGAAGVGGTAGPVGGGGDALACCPGAGLAHSTVDAGPGEIAELRADWGPVYALWEGYATDPQIRYAGSSGGVATALAAYCIEQAGMAGVLHIGARPDVPYLNEARYSRTRAELVAAAGSRYAPASPCERLDLIEAESAPSVFIGKPCDVAATGMAAKVRPALAAKLGLTIGIFCAGTPSTRGTLAMLAAMGVTDPASVRSVRYRGQGWPGQARASVIGDPPDADRCLTYEQSWGEILQRYRQWRCYLCVDHTGEFADVAVGDPWYRPTGDDPGRSLVLARTERGLQLITAAMQAGVLHLEPVAPTILPASQPNLLKARGAVWGRIATLRLAGQAAPRFARMPMAGLWWRHLSLREKLRSTAGTLLRIRRRRLWRSVALTEYQPWSTTYPSPSTTEYSPSSPAGNRA